MKGLEWRAIGRGELADLLRNAGRVASRAVGETTIYRLEGDGREMLAIALAGGQTIVVEAAAPAKRRRHVDKGTLSPASR